MRLKTSSVALTEFEFLYCNLDMRENLQHKSIANRKAHHEPSQAFPLITMAVRIRDHHLLIFDAPMSQTAGALTIWRRGGESCERSRAEQDLVEKGRSRSWRCCMRDSSLLRGPGGNSYFPYRVANAGCSTSLLQCCRFRSSCNTGECLEMQPLALKIALLPTHHKRHHRCICPPGRRGRHCSRDCATQSQRGH